MGEGRNFGSFLKCILLLLSGAPDPDFVLLCLRSVLLEGHTVTGSSLNSDLGEM